MGCSEFDDLPGELSRLHSLADHFLIREVLDGHYFRIIRAVPTEPALKSAPSQNMRKLNGPLIRRQQRVAAQAFRHTDRSPRWLKRMFSHGTLNSQRSQPDFRQSGRIVRYYSPKRREVRTGESPHPGSRWNFEFDISRFVPSSEVLEPASVGA